ncbi:MAG: FecR domain-containing protein [Planctomycetes bacterium]|nr:FecR domain-containing protein [Planctomycetota bacterium]
MMRHLDDELATYYAYGLAEDQERRDVESHLRECPECAAKVRTFQEERPQLAQALDRIAAPGLEARILRPRRLPRGLLLAAAAAVVIAIGVRLLAPSPRGLVRGEIAVRHGDRWEPQRAPATLLEGQIFRVEGSQTAEIVLDDASRATLAPGTSATFGGRRGERAALELHAGQGRFVVTPSKERFFVVTPVGTVTVLGTEFLVDVWEGEKDMNKALAIGAPIAVGVAVIVGTVVFRTPQGEARLEGGKTAVARTGGAPQVLSARETERLRREVESLREQLAAQTARAETAEAKLPAPVKPESKQPIDWKTERGPEFEAKLRAVAWDKGCGAFIQYACELDQAVREGRPPNLSPENLAGLSQFNQKAMELADALGLDTKDWMNVYQNELVQQYFADAFLKVLAGQPLTEAQLAKLRQIDPLSSEGASPDDGRLAQFRNGIQKNLALLTKTREVLQPEQYEHLANLVTPTFRLGIQGYAEKTFPADTAHQGVVTHWMETFKLSKEHAATVDIVAAEYVERLAQVTARYEKDPTKEREAELRIKLLDLQIEAEKKLADSLPLDDEQKTRVLRGSGAAILLK